MRLGKTAWILLANILAMHLYMELQQEMGLKSDPKSPTLERLGILRTRATSVEFALLRSWPDLKKVLTATVIS